VTRSTGGEAIIHGAWVRSGLAAGLLLIASAGCASTAGPLPTAGPLLLAAVPGASAELVQASPEAYRGQRVMLGGTIVAAHPRSDGMDVEVIKWPLAADGRPEKGDRMTGRFFVRSTGPLDATTDAPGQAVTAVAVVAPMESWWDDGDSSQRYPVLTFADLRLWPPDTMAGTVRVGQRYWVWPYTFWQGPPPYVPLIINW